MQAAAAYNRGYLAFSDLKNCPLANAAVYDLQSNALDPYGVRSCGDRWEARLAYKVGEVITPSTGTAGNGHTYRCTTAGTSQNPGPPTFPTGDSATLADGTAVFAELTAHAGTVIDFIPTSFFVLTSFGSGGTFSARRDVFLGVTIKNGNGESVMSTARNATTNTLRTHHLPLA